MIICSKCGEKEPKAWHDENCKIESKYLLDKDYKWMKVHGGQLAEMSIKGRKNDKYVELKIRFCPEDLLGGKLDLDELKNVEIIYGRKIK